MYRMQVGTVGGKPVFAESKTGTFKRSEVEKVKKKARQTYNQEQEVKAQRQVATGQKQAVVQRKKLEDIVETGGKALGLAGLFGVAIPGGATIALLSQLFKTVKRLPPMTSEQRSRIAKLSQERQTITRLKRRRLKEDPFKKRPAKEKPFVPKSEAFLAYLREGKKVTISKPAMAKMTPETILIQRFLPAGLKWGYR